MKPKVLLISEDIRANSGVGIMSRYIVEDTSGSLDWVQIGSLATHPEKGKIVELNGMKIYATEGFGPIELIRHVIETEKPHAIMLFMDPRVFHHVWNHEDEIRSRVPIFYLNIWDAGPAPLWNLGAYLSCDHLGAISRQTYALNGHVAPNVPRSYIPHGTDLKVYHPLPDEESRKWLREKIKSDPSFSVLYVNRNIRRKNPSDLGLAVHRLIEKTGDEEITLLMRTEPIDPDGTDIPAVLEGIGFKGRVVFFGGLSPEEMNLLYNAADITVNIASNEGFGIATIESLAAGTPILVNMTGGLQDQVGLLKADGTPVTLEDYSSEWYTNADGRFRNHGTHANVVYPRRIINGSPVTPYVMQEFADSEDVTRELLKLYGQTREFRKSRGLRGRQYLIDQGMTREVMAEKVKKAILTMIDDFIPRDRYSIIDSSSHPYRTEAGVITETHTEEV